MAWDDDTIDEPNHVPVLDVEHGEKREANKEAFAAEIAFFHSIGSDRHEIAERMNEAWDSIVRRLQRHGREDLIAQIQDIPTREMAGATV